MRYRTIVMAGVPALAGLLSIQPTPAPTPERAPSVAEIDAALAYAEREAGLPPASSHRTR